MSRDGIAGGNLKFWPNITESERSRTLCWTGAELSTGNQTGSAIPPGWYHDPLNPQTSVRYWNGTSWTQHSQRIPHSPLTTDPEQTSVVTTDAGISGQRIGAERSPGVPTRGDDHIGPPGWDRLTGPPHPRQLPSPERTGSQGWYPDPGGSSPERYWNGSSWEDKRRRVSRTDPFLAESSQLPADNQPNTVPRLPGYRALSSLLAQLTQRGVLPEKPADHSGPARDKQFRNALILLAASAVLMVIGVVGERLGLFPDETTAAPTSAAAAPSVSTSSSPSPTSTPPVPEPAPTAPRETEPALANLEQELLALQITWSQMSQSDRRDFCVAYTLGGDDAWDVFDEQANSAVSKEAYLTFFGKRC